MEPDRRSIEWLVTCVACTEEVELLVGPDELKNWIKDYAYYQSVRGTSRPRVDDYFPYLTLGEKEILISGMCEQCFDKMTEEEDEV